MAVVQISKVQVRRGLQQDLPQLSGGEFGWSMDAQRLFIGNGGTGEGAPEEGITELLTLRRLTEELPNAVFYTFKGEEGGYIVRTGPDLNHPVVRTFQRKLDSWVSVRDFGALGDGFTDDTEAINRAILQIYDQSRLQASPLVRRILRFEAGTYMITGNIIKLPPWIHVMGDGFENTIIKQVDGTQPGIFEVCNSSYVIGSTIGSGGVTLPKYVTVSNMTLQNDTDNDIVVIDSARGIYFHRVNFQGPLGNPTSAGTAAGVRIINNATATKDVIFDSCGFTGVRNALVSDVECTDIKIINCSFSSINRGIVLGESSVGSYPKNVRIFNCFFESVANRAIDIFSGVSGVSSIGNHYADCGNNFGATPVSTVINFAYGNNYSISDTFDRSDNAALSYARVESGNARNVYISVDKGIVAGTMTIGVGELTNLSDNISIATTTDITLSSPCVLNYSITRGGSYRIGSIRFSNDGSGPEYYETYTESKTSVGVTFEVNSSNIVTYRTTSTGVDATLKYNINHF